MNRPVCIVSGAAGNLGEVVVRKLQDHFFVEAMVRKAQVAEEHIHYNQLDLTDEMAANALVLRCVQKHKKIHSAVLIAGGFTVGDLAATDYASVEKMLTLNFKTAYTIIRPIYEHMQSSGGGNIIVIGAKSAHQLESGSFAIAYTLSKAMLLNLAEILNADRDKSKVTIHVIVPGTIDTIDNRKAMPGADLSKWVTPETLANKIAELCLSSFDAKVQTIHTFY
jgi:NAD(P)-dependent dehydrogenase (short-subunit alcohol dehydrogenase family)